MTATELKNSILQFAVQGKLVPQNPHDEPASELLKKIEAEKEKLIKEKVIKKDKPLLPIKEEDKPFEIPESWEWCRLDDISVYIQRGKSPEYSETDKNPVISQKCVQRSGFSIDKAKFITSESLKNYAEERYLKNYDLLWNSTGLGTLGRIALYKETLNPYKIAVADSHVTVIRVLKEFINAQYMYYYFANPSVQSVIEDKSDGSTKQKELATSTIRSYIVPLPPLAEQQLIVSKIEELLPLVEQYGTAESELRKLNTKFPEQLKKSVLQYAVQGKLVSQNPHDEPASELLKKIKAEKERLIKEKVIKKDKPLLPIKEEDKPFEIPESWEWVRLGDLAEINGGFAFKSSNYSEEGIRVIRISDFDEYGFKNHKVVRHKYSDNFKQYQLEEENILIAMTGGTVGKSLFVKNLNERMYVNQRVATIKINPILNPFYANYLILSPITQDVVNERKNSTNDNISMEDINGFLFPLPPLSEQQLIVEKVEEVLRVCEELKM